MGPPWTLFLRRLAPQFAAILPVAYNSLVLHPVREIPACIAKRTRTPTSIDRLYGLSFCALNVCLQNNFHCRPGRQLAYRADDVSCCLHARLVTSMDLQLDVSTSILSCRLHAVHTAVAQNRKPFADACKRHSFSCYKLAFSQTFVQQIISIDTCLAEQ